MYYRKLGHTGLLASEIGCDAAVLADPTLTDADAIALAQEAIAAGVNLFEIVGRGNDGLACRRAAQAFADRRERVLIATRGGRATHDAPFDPARLETDVRAALAALDCAYLDLFQLDRPSSADLESAALWETLARLQREGCIRHVGIVAATPAEARAALATRRIAALQIPFNARAADMRPLLAEARRAGIAVLAASPLLRGTLARETPPPDADAVTHAVLARLRRCAAESACTPAQAALGWVLAHEEVTAALPSPRTSAELAEALAVSDLPLPPERVLLAIQHAWHTVPAS